jgi:hypothetical protein
MSEKRRPRRDASVSIKTLPDIKAALERAATDDDRTMAQYLERVLVAHLTEKGYLE